MYQQSNGEKLRTYDRHKISEGDGLKRRWRMVSTAEAEQRPRTGVCDPLVDCLNMRAGLEHQSRLTLEDSMEEKIKQLIKQRQFKRTAALDPRCKMALLILIGCVSYFLNGEVASLILVVTLALFIAIGNGSKWAAKMLVFYVIVAYLNALLRYVSIPVLSVVMSVFGVTILKLVPIAMMGIWTLRTTHMDDLMVSLQRLRLPQSVTIPLVVMFRYIPTLRIEYRMIRNTMDIRKR